MKICKITALFALSMSKALQVSLPKPNKSDNVRKKIEKTYSTEERKNLINTNTLMIKLATVILCISIVDSFIKEVVRKILNM